MPDNPIEPGKQWNEPWLDEDAFRRQFEGNSEALREELIKAWSTERRAPTDTESLALAKFLVANPDYLLPLRLLGPGIFSILMKFIARSPTPKLRNEDISTLVDVYLAAGFALGEAREAVANSLKKSKEAVERADQRVRNKPRQK
jgi:hypothetical protein